jgi:cysteine desulfurase / selenocysteine lyase
VAQPDWNAVRGEFPALANQTFLNTATYGQLPRRSVAATMRHFERRDELACADFLEWFDDMDQIRESVGRLVSCDATDVAFINNAATALGWLLTGLEWQPGDRIVTLANEFPNNLYAAVLQHRGVEFAEVEWDDLADALTDRTRLVLLSTVNYSTGFRPPLAELSTELRRRGILLYVDGTQSVGALRFDIREVQPDMLAVHGYKWLLSPNGAGFAYIAPGLREVLRPSVIGWRSDRGWREVDSLHHGAPRFKDAAERYEGGMLNFPSLYAMGVSVELMLELGPAEIEGRVLGLARGCEAVLTDAGAVVEHTGSPILAARFPGEDVSRIGQALKDERVLVSARHGRLRVSVHFYNNEADLDRFQEVLCRTVGNRGVIQESR